jgi:two-component system, chemotaxis family, CheB/CheR fusion protein
VVSGDAMKVHRIAQNLLFNAVKYTQQGGVWVRWRPLSDSTKPAGWMLTIQDSGPGLGSDASAQATAVTASIAADSTHQRSEGLGLAIVRRLCGLLDATVEVRSAQGEGTTFTVSFPAEPVSSS